MFGTLCLGPYSVMCQLISSPVFNQYGFMTGKSTMTNLLVREKNIAKALDANQSLDVITFNFSRAFYHVPHHRLLQQLSSYGLSDKMAA